MADDLSSDQCILLTVHYASEGNIKALHSFTPTRLDALEPELVLRILLTYLPESLDPRDYTTYVSEVASRLYLDVDREDVVVDLSPVKDIEPAQARRRVRKLALVDIESPGFPPHAPRDLLTRFLCHRAYRIDAATGLLNLIPHLIEPFLQRHGYLRTWYISVVLPVLRLEDEYYPEDESLAIGLNAFEKLDGDEGIDFLMRKAASFDASEVARDIKGLVGPWMYGHTARKRRKLDQQQPKEQDFYDEGLTSSMGKINLESEPPKERTGHDWEHMYRWMVFHARENFPLVQRAVEDWDGPGDVDLGGFNSGNADQYLDEDVQSKLETQYAQAAFAACYAVQADTIDTVHGAHAILARLAELLDFIPPPDLATTVESLPKIESQAVILDESQTLADLEPDALLKPGHPLTAPRLESYMLLQMIVYSTYQFSSLGYPISLVNATKLHFYTSAEEQLAVLQKVLRGLSKDGVRKDETQWKADRAKLIWLWNWGIDADDSSAHAGAGVLGKIKKQSFEEEMLKCFCETSCYELAINLYLASPGTTLPHQRVEDIVLTKSMEAYDSASNGNRTRGGMKKANEIISTFSPYFPESARFRQASALISATHALSFYSLTLQHGVPFQPVSIRVSQDPVGLISRVLEQNPRSYAQLDDLVAIGQNLVSAGLLEPDDGDDMYANRENDSIESKRMHAARRVIFMAMEAALREDDFETAYSYIVNRLTPTSAEIEAPTQAAQSTKGHTRTASKHSTQSRIADTEDDVSWRAAFLAGRYRPASSSPPTLRRLEQRTELLSLALLLAPVSALTEVLTAWRRCEEEMTSLQLANQQAEEEFDDRADKRQSMSSLPGNFTIQGEQPAMVLNQERREMGRMSTAKGAGGDVAPVSMFDLTRSAAQAFSKNAFPLRAGATSASGQGSGSMEASTEGFDGDDALDNQQRVRKRDMVANAVSGGLASGLGWVLGATPVKEQQQRNEQL